MEVARLDVKGARTHLQNAVTTYGRTLSCEHERSILAILWFRGLVHCWLSVEFNLVDGTVPIWYRPRVLPRLV